MNYIAFVVDEFIHREALSDRPVWWTWWRMKQMSRVSVERHNWPWNEKGRIYVCWERVKLYEN